MILKLLLFYQLNISPFDIVGQHKNATNVYLNKWIKPIPKIYMSSYPQEGEKKEVIFSFLHVFFNCSYFIDSQ